MKADAVINATVLFKKERLRKISCNDRDRDNVIKLYNKAEVKKYESWVELNWIRGFISEAEHTDSPSLPYFGKVGQYFLHYTVA